jgi:hypothetical protein
MEGSIQVSEQRLLQISADLHNRMNEVRALREALQAEEAIIRRRREPIHPASVAPPGNELRV